MITRMEVESSLPGAPAIPLGGFMPNDDPVQIKNIDGLGPVKADISSTAYATARGDLFQGSSTGKRNIVLTVGLNPDWVDQTIGSLRQLLYRYFIPEMWTKLRFFTDELPEVFINGVVESCDPAIFSQDPEMQISIICPKPDFIDVSTTLIHGTTDSALEVAIPYIGTAPTGFEIRVEASDTVTTYTGDVIVSNHVGDLAQSFGVRAVTVNGTKYLKVNTVRTQRQVYNVRVSDGVVVNIMAKMDRNVIWPEFNSGENVLVVGTATAGLDWTLGYFNRFGGL